MISKLALLANLLLVSATLIVPSTPRRMRLARRQQLASRITLPADIGYNQDGASAYWEEASGTFTTVTGTFAVPTLTSTASSLSIWVGIDGYSCDTTILQVGVDLSINNGETSYAAWYEWYPDYAYDFSGVTISSGDIIQATVTAYSTTAGTVSIENLTTGQTVTQDVTSSYALCEQDAEWIVEGDAFSGTLTITNATASGPSGKIYTPTGATIIESCGPGTVTTNGDTLTIKCI